MNKIMLSVALALAVATSAAAVTDAFAADGADVAPEIAVRSYYKDHQAKCVIKYQKCCEEKKYKQCEKDECHKYWYCPKKHSYHAAVPDSAAAGGEVDASIKSYGHYNSGYKKNDYKKKDYKTDYGYKGGYKKNDYKKKEYKTDYGYKGGYKKNDYKKKDYKTDYGYKGGYKQDYGCYWKQDCKKVHYSCEHGSEYKCYDHKEKWCHGDWCHGL